MPTSISVIEANTQTADLSLKAIDVQPAIYTNSTFTYPFTITNNASESSDQITLKIYSQGVAYSSFSSTSDGSWACTVQTIDFGTLTSQLTCALSSLAAGTSADYQLTLGSGAQLDGILRLEVFTDKPEAEGSDNRIDLTFPITLDSDGDGVGDSEDAFPFDRAETVDTDKDGVGNNADTDDDGDSVLDENDAFPLNPDESLDTDHDGTGNNADTDDDGDGVADGDDAYPLIGLGGLIDTDDDGSPNDCDAACQATGMDADTDDDGDGLSDDAELNVHGTNPLLADTDGDSMEDGQELEEGLNPLDDSDCPSWICGSSKVYLYKIAAERADSDRDGLTNKVEESLGTDSNNPDSDGDGLTDGDEVNTYNTDPIVADTDGDGLSDGAEVNTYGTLPLVSDTDGDSVDDGEEIQEGLDPLNGDDCPDWICGSSKSWLYNIKR